MAMQKVTATGKVKDEDGNVVSERTIEVEYDFGDDIDAAVDAFGADVVMSNYRQSAVIALQSRLRAQIAAGLKDNEIAAKAEEWKPGFKSVTRKSPVDKVRDLLSGKTPEEIAAILKEATGG